MKEYALMGLMCWYENMIPTLLPFMILTSFLIRLHLESVIIRPIYPLFQKVFHVRPEMIFEILLGFLCGFPMGSKITSELYQNGRINKIEAEYLLTFTNNVSPAYFWGFVCATFYGGKNLWPFWGIQYGIPLCYGILLRYTFYRNSIPCKLSLSTASCKTVSSQSTPATPLSARRLVEALDEAINTGLVQIAALGGYMIVFNTLVFFPATFLRTLPFPALISHLLLEISGGLLRLKQFQTFHTLSDINLMLLIQATLTANGLCCLFQTIKYLKGTNLSIKKYMLHKGILCSITCLCILLWDALIV